MAATSYTYTPGSNLPGVKVTAAPSLFAQRVTLTGGLAAGGYVPTVAILAGAGTVGSISGQAGYDMAGNFVLTAGTAALNGGSLASVTFGQQLDVAPVAVQVNAAYTTGSTGLAVGAASLTKSGFTVTGPAPASGAAYLISYLVIRSPL